MEHETSLNEVLAGFELVVIKYDTYAKGKHPQTGEVIERSFDTVAFYGEYEWNSKGGVVHWTHNDPHHRHIDGMLKYYNKIYQ
jgi:hypothetical protein